MKQVLTNRRVAMRLAVLSLGLFGFKPLYGDNPPRDVTLELETEETQQIEVCNEYDSCMKDLRLQETRISDAYAELKNAAALLLLDIQQIDMYGDGKEWTAARKDTAKNYAVKLLESYAEGVRTSYAEVGPGSSSPWENFANSKPEIPLPYLLFGLVILTEGGLFLYRRKRSNGTQ